MCKLTESVFFLLVMKCWLRTKHPFEHHRKRLRMSVPVIRPHWKWQTNDWFKSLVSVCNCSWFRDAFHVVCASDVLAWRRECSVCMSTLMRTRVKALTTKWGRATFQSKNWSFLFILQTLWSPTCWERKMFHFQSSSLLDSLRNLLKNVFWGIEKWLTQNPMTNAVC